MRLVDRGDGPPPRIDHHRPEAIRFSHAPIKREVWIGYDQLLEMFYWLKLIRAFDERLSVLVKQARFAAASYRHQPGSHHRRHRFGLHDD
jgi:hypothetical protein